MKILNLYFLLAMTALEIRGALITFYWDARSGGNGGGVHDQVNIWRCFNFEGDWNDKISSLDTAGACIWCYRDRDCQGESRQFGNFDTGCSHENLQFCNFNDCISSCKPC